MEIICQDLKAGNVITEVINHLTYLHNFSDYQFL